MVPSYSALKIMNLKLVFRCGSGEDFLSNCRFKKRYVDFAPPSPLSVLKVLNNPLSLYTRKMLTFRDALYLQLSIKQMRGSTVWSKNSGLPKTDRRAQFNLYWTFNKKRTRNFPNQTKSTRNFPNFENLTNS